MLEVRIEAVTSGDLDAVLAIEALSFPTPWTRSAFEYEITQNKTGRYWLARSGDAVLGYIGVWLILDEAHITTVAVSPESRGQRIGERLLVHLLQACQVEGIKWVTLEVRKDNTAALKLYEKFGFVKAGERKEYYEGGIDALVMWAGNLQGQKFQERLAEIQKGWRPC